MKAIERQEKFNQFRDLLQDGSLNSITIAKHLGISKNTVYNWRKKIRLEGQCLPDTFPAQKPSVFSRIVVPSLPGYPTTSFIEITLQDTIQFRKKIRTGLLFVLYCFISFMNIEPASTECWEGFGTHGSQV
jgi:hypothetical protein